LSLFSGVQGRLQGLKAVSRRRGKFWGFFPLLGGFKWRGFGSLPVPSGAFPSH